MSPSSSALPWKRFALGAAVVVLTAFTFACTSPPPLPTADHVDLESFMGPWYVVGYTPIIVDKDAYNAVEQYVLEDDGDIRTTYQFRKGGFDGPLKTYTPVGRVYNEETHAEWRMQFVWPFEAEYIVFHLSEDGRRTIIAHPNRKYAWIMQRSPDVDDAVYAEMVGLLEAEGFDPDAIRRVPHDWTDEAERLEQIRAAGDQTPLSEF